MDGPHRISVGLLDGTEVVGRTQGFRPQAPDLFVEVEGDAEPELRRLVAESVCYVAVHHAAGEQAPARATSSAALRVHLGSGRSLVVDPVGDPLDPLGFWGVPLDGENPFERIYFFAHGRKALERNETLGAMLVNQGLVAPQDLERGLDRQASLRKRRIGEMLLEQKFIEPEQLDRGLALQRRGKMRLGEVLVEAGLASEEDVQAALTEQSRHRGRRIGEILAEMGVITERRLAETLAEKFHLPFVDLDDCLVDPQAIRALPRRVVERHRILPIEVDDAQITIALSDPLDTEGTDLVRFQRKGRVREVVGIPSQIERHLKELLGSPVGLDDANVPGQVDVEGAGEDAEDSHAVHESDNAIIQLTDQILVEAVRRGASDVHIEPNGARDPVKLRLRIDGQCVVLPDIPASHRHALVSRLKIMAQLDIAERRKPQDGKIRVRLPGHTFEVRVATLPTVGGEDIVLRILSNAQAFPMDELGFSERDQRRLEEMVANPNGLILCVGPTGSGKSTTLHALLAHINTPEKKIWTAEDPVEITQPGLRQVPVRPRIGFGFAEALRAFLRADPDVIMIGEMRDRETAQIAIEASLTGHLVLSTLHTNSAAETVVRLVEMGIDPLTFGDALLGVLAQRLVRRLCEDCRALGPGAPADLEKLRSILADEADEVGHLLWHGRGCPACRGTGYRGRIALHELLAVDEELREAIRGRSGADRIRRTAAADGMRTLLEQGARRCLDGTTDLSQVLAVCVR